MSIFAVPISASSAQAAQVLLKKYIRECFGFDWPGVLNLRPLNTACQLAGIVRQILRVTNILNVGPCGASSYVATDDLTDFDYPPTAGNYRSNLNCRWNFTANDPSNRIRIDFNFFETEECCDYLSVSLFGKVFLFIISLLCVCCKLVSAVSTHYTSNALLFSLERPLTLIIHQSRAVCCGGLT